MINTLSYNLKDLYETAKLIHENTQPVLKPPLCFIRFMCPHALSVYIHVENLFICVWFSFPETVVTHCWWYVIPSTGHTTYCLAQLLRFLCITVCILVNTCWIKAPAPGVCPGLLICRPCSWNSSSCIPLQYFKFHPRASSSTNIQQHNLTTSCELYNSLEAPGSSGSLTGRGGRLYLCIRFLIDCGRGSVLKWRSSST